MNEMKILARLYFMLTDSKLDANSFDFNLKFTHHKSLHIS